MFFINSPKFGPVHTARLRSCRTPLSSHLLPSPTPFFALFFSSPQKRKEVTLTQEKKNSNKKKKNRKERRISRQDACADNIDPRLPLKHLLCLTEFCLLDFLRSRMNHRCLLKCHRGELLQLKNNNSAFLHS